MNQEIHKVSNMANTWRVVCMCVIAFTFPANLVADLTMATCVNGWTNIHENSKTTISCSGINQTQMVHWTVEHGATRNKTVFKGWCAKKCSFTKHPDIYLRINNISESLLVITRNQRRYAGATVTCFDTKTHLDCRVNVIHFPKLSKCRTEISPSSQSVTGSCEINKLFSSNSPVQCTALRHVTGTADGSEHLQGQIFLQTYTDPIDNNTYQRGNCSFIADLPTAMGNYTYDLVVDPSLASETTGEIRIGDSEISCTTLLEENVMSKCECFKRRGQTPSYVCNLSRKRSTSALLCLRNWV